MSVAYRRRNYAERVGGARLDTGVGDMRRDAGGRLVPFRCRGVLLVRTRGCRGPRGGRSRGSSFGGEGVL